MLSIGIRQQLYTIILAKLTQILGILGHLGSGNNAIVSWLRLTSRSDHFPHPYQIHKKCLGLWYAVSRVSYHSTGQVSPRFRILGHLWSENDAIMSWLRLSSISKCFSHPYQIYKVFGHIDTLCLVALHHYTSQIDSDLGILVHLRSINDAIMRLFSTLDYYIHPYQTYTKCLINWYAVMLWPCCVVESSPQVWCKPGWVKISQRNILRVFLCPILKIFKVITG